MMESCNLSPIVFFVFCFATVGNDPQEDLAKFDYNLNIKVKINKTSFYILGYIFEPCIEIWLLSFTIWLWEISKKALHFSTF
jgi:hypothetical protein